MRITAGWLLFLVSGLAFSGCGGHELRDPLGDTPIFKSFTLRFVGDAILTVSVNHYVDRYGPGYLLAKMKPYLQGADYTIANLESCFTTNGIPYRRKKYTFRARPSFMAILRDAGIDAVSLANNHLLDFGEIGMRDTFRTLKRYRIPGFGAGDTLHDALKPLVLRAGGTPVFLFSVNDIYPSSFHATTNRAGTAPLDLPLLTKAIRRVKRAGNLVIVQPHWGWELRAFPNPKQIRQARALIDAGADAVIGHHPHVPQSIAIYRGKPIVYSLGNFVVGYWNPRYRNNIGVTLHGYRGRITTLHIHSIAGRNLRTQFQPRIIRGEAGKRDMRYLEAISRRFGTRIEILPDGSGRIRLDRDVVARFP